MKIWVFEACSDDWAKWYPMLHIEPCTSLLNAEKKLKKVAKDRPSFAWRITPYESQRSLQKGVKSTEANNEANKPLDRSEARS